MSIRLYDILMVESSSYCNRRCKTCLRQNDPAKSRFNLDESAKKEFASTKTVLSAVDQAWNMGFRGSVALCYFNEPLLDERLPYFASYVKEKGLQTMLATNTDYLTESYAEKLDGLVDLIHLSIYDRRNFSVHMCRIKSMFRKTRLVYDGLHVISHYSPFANGLSIEKLVQSRRNLPCKLPLRHLIVNYEGDYMLCCEDLAGNFGLGNVRDTPLKDYWYGKKHLEIIAALSHPKGRITYPYCACCPKYEGFTKPRVEVQQ